MKTSMTLFSIVCALVLVMGCSTTDNPISSQDNSIRGVDYATPWDPDPILPGDFRTETQGGWGGKNGSAANYRDDNFAAAFPGGLVVGCVTGYTATFTTSAAIEKFLPAGGPAAALTSSVVDPTKSNQTGAGGFLGQITALALSVGFDEYDPNFGASTIDLADLIVIDGPCAGWTVGEVLAEANLALGGCTSTLPIADLHTCVGLINENFVEGETVGDFLELP